ncbi:MAG: class I SAM-dependent methyltransferase [Ignavibacteriales bacterium]|nr:MAG: class I SAM-dependent methyltransferase [Ignavibacteriales bacterium]
MNKKFELSTVRFDNPEFVLKYAVNHSRKSVKIADKIADILFMKNLKKGRILDAGCGTGITLIQLAKKIPFRELYGIDLSGISITAAKEASQGENLEDRIKFLKADVMDIPFPDNYFNFVINIYMLHLVEDPVRMLNEIERVLQPEGFFFITDLKRNFLSILEKEMKSAFTEEEVKDIIAQSTIPLGQFSYDMISWKYQSI